MPAGEAFSAGQRAEVDRALAAAHRSSGLPFSVYVGPLGEGAEAPAALHAGLANAERAVLVAVDPGTRQVEVVTGRVAAQSLDDRACALAVMSMTTSFAAGDLAGGLRDGIVLLGEHAKQPRVMHLDQP